MFHSIIQDIRYGFRMLSKNPGFTCVIILTLALGIGANAAIFSVVNGLLLKPLHYMDPEQIVTILHEGHNPVSPADFLDWREQNQSFQTIAAAESWGGTLTGEGQPEAIRGIRFSEGMFDVLGVDALIGRTFQPDDYQPGKSHVLILGYSLWLRRFNGAPDVIGRQITLDNESYTVIGVMPPTFRFAPFWLTKAAMAAPLDLAPRASLRAAHSLRIFARLKPDVSRELAQSEMNEICLRLEKEFPETNAGRTIQVDPLLEKVIGDVRQGLLFLSAAVIFLLLIACTNVANLLLARSIARQKEIAVRASLGATRWRIVRQLLAESLIVVFIAGAAGFILGDISIDWIKGMLTGDSVSYRVRMPRVTEIEIDSATLYFTIFISLITGLIFGLAPALQASRPNLQKGMLENSRGSTTSRSGRKLQNSLVSIEIALAVIMLTGAGLMLRSFTNLTYVDPGFNPRNILSSTISITGMPEYAGKPRTLLYRRILDGIESLPGVEEASAINHLPMDGDLWGRTIAIEDHPLPPPGERDGAAYRVSLPGYFHTMGIPFLKGRDFTNQDAAGSTPVVVINDKLAQKYWPNSNPIGKRLAIEGLDDSPKWLEIVGVVKNVKQGELREEVWNEIYLPLLQQEEYINGTEGHFSYVTLVVRTNVPPMSVVPAMQDIVWSESGKIPISNIVTLDQVINNSIWQPRFNLILIVLFASLGLMLGAIGIYGVMSYAVSQRVNEIGLRMALGAQKKKILQLIIGQGLRLVAIGVVVGLLGAVALTHIIQSLLYDVSSVDPIAYICSTLLLLFVSFLACYIPARRAAKVDPMTALRCE
ncbi:ABC transporter permease [bacterium]|nr:ABC transporter permease [bacterium]